MSTAVIINQVNQQSETEIRDFSNEEKKINIGWCMSAGIETSSNDDFQTQRQHFHEKTNSDIFFRHLPEGNVSSGNASIDREELSFPSAGHAVLKQDEKQCHSPSKNTWPNTNWDEMRENKEIVGNDKEFIPPAAHDKHVDERHFHSSTEDDLLPKWSADPHIVRKDKELFFSADQKQGERHFHSSSKDDLLPKWSANRDMVRNDKELFPSAGHDKNADQKQGEGHFYSSSEDDLQPKWCASCHIMRKDKGFFPSAGHDIHADQKQGEKHFHSSSKDDLQSKWSANCDMVRNDKELFHSPGHDIHADQKQGKRHFHAPSEDDLRPKWHAN